MYLDHVRVERKYRAALRTYEEICDEKQVLFQRTQPGAIDYGKERVGGSPEDPLEQYIQALEDKQIDKRLEAAKQIVEDRRAELDAIRNELYESNSLNDKIYRMRKIENLPVPGIARRVYMSESQVYRILEKIEKKTRENASESVI